MFKLHFVSKATYSNDDSPKSAITCNVDQDILNGAFHKFLFS